MNFKFFVVFCFFSSVFLTGCSSTSETVYDPWEPVNRATYGFNKVVDKALFKPVAKGYEKAVPQPFRKGVNNFFSNLGEINTVFNDLLQAKFLQAGHDTLRFGVNSVFGFFGFFDVASLNGLEKHDEDLGQTLAFWGLKKSPYFVVPFFGPSTVIDFVADWGTTKIRPLEPVLEVDHVPTRNSIFALMAVDKRVSLLDAERLLEDSEDEYALQRSLYEQYRQSLVRDGAIEEDGFEFED